MSETPDKIAHVHLMRTAGTFVNAYLAKELRNTHDIKVSWFDGLGRDWYPEELLGFLESGGPVYVHNHLAGWSRELVNRFNDAGFLTFAFVRNPGDQLCSLFGLIEQRNANSSSLTLDEFILRQVRGEEIFGIDHHHWAIPSWWEEIGSVTEFNEEAFSGFVQTQLDRAWKPQLAAEAARNHTGNRGFDWHYRAGDIHPSTRHTLDRSEFQERYRAVRAAKAGDG